MFISFYYVHDVIIIHFPQVGTLLGGDPNSTRSQMQDVIYFEAKLASIMSPDEDRRDEEKIYHRMNISEVESKAPFVS